MSDLINLVGTMIPILALCIPIVAIWTRHKHQIAKMQSEANAKTLAAQASRHTSEIEQLEERVRVLERILTDRGVDVAHQIEALRDASQLEKKS